VGSKEERHDKISVQRNAILDISHGMFKNVEDKK
jgi:hypothetical protein